MKSAIVAAAAVVLADGVYGGHVNHRHAHDLFKKRSYPVEGETCVPGCTTIYSTITGEPTRMWRKTQGSCLTM